MAHTHNPRGFTMYPHITVDDRVNGHELLADAARVLDAAAADGHDTDGAVIGVATWRHDGTTTTAMFPDIVIASVVATMSAGDVADIALYDARTGDAVA